MSDDYELLPVDELERLRHEVEVLKANPFGDSKDGQTLLQAVQELTVTIRSLLKVFESAQKAVLEDAKNLKPVQEQFDQVIDQNEKIASGIVALADMIADLKDSSKSVSSEGVNAVSPSSSLSPGLPPSPSSASSSSRDVPSGNLPPLPDAPPFSQPSGGLFGSVGSNNPQPPVNGSFPDGSAPGPSSFLSHDLSSSPSSSSPSSLDVPSGNLSQGFGSSDSSGNPMSSSPSPSVSSLDVPFGSVPKPPEKKKLFGLFK